MVTWEQNDSAGALYSQWLCVCRVKAVQTSQWKSGEIDSAAWNRLKKSFFLYHFSRRAHLAKIKAAIFENRRIRFSGRCEKKPTPERRESARTAVCTVIPTSSAHDVLATAKSARRRRFWRLDGMAGETTSGNFPKKRFIRLTGETLARERVREEKSLRRGAAARVREQMTARVLDWWCEPMGRPRQSRPRALRCRTQCRKIVIRIRSPYG